MNTKKILAAGIIGLSVLLPIVALAQNTPSESLNWTNVSSSIKSAIWEIFALLAVIMFVIAGISFLTAGGDPDKVKLARTEFLWGVVGVVVALLAYSLVGILAGIIGA